MVLPSSGKYRSLIKTVPFSFHTVQVRSFFSDSLAEQACQYPVFAEGTHFAVLATAAGRCGCVHPNQRMIERSKHAIARVLLLASAVRISTVCAVINRAM